MDLNLARWYKNSLVVRRLVNESLKSQKSDRKRKKYNPQPLTDIVLKVIAENILDFIDVYKSGKLKNHEDTLLTLLSIDLPFRVMAQHIPDGMYWKRACYNTWKKRDFLLYEATSWKKIYMQTYLQKYLENITDTLVNQIQLVELLDLVKDMVEVLNIFLFPNLVATSGYLDLRIIFASLVNLKEIRIEIPNTEKELKFQARKSHITHSDNTILEDIILPQVNIFKLQRSSLMRIQLQNIFSVISLMSQLTHLEITCCDLSEKSMSDFANIISPICSIQILILINNRIGPNETLALAPTLSVLNNLSTLDLRLNSIRDQGMGNITSSLKHHKSLNTVIFSACGLTDSSKEYLKSIFSSIPSLINVSLDCNDIHQFSEILGIIESNYTLRKLNLKMNPIPSEDIKSVNRIIKRNQAIE